MPYDQAVQKLQDDGFKLGETKYGFSNNATEGLVARQSPAAGVKLERGGSVVLTVVRPLGSLTTPNLVGQTQAAAESALATMTLKPRSPRTTARRSRQASCSCRHLLPV